MAKKTDKTYTPIQFVCRVTAKKNSDQLTTMLNLLDANGYLICNEEQSDTCTGEAFWIYSKEV